MQVGGGEQLFSVDVEQSVRGNRAIRGRAEKLVGLLHGGVDWEKRAEALQVQISVLLLVGTDARMYPIPARTGIEGQIPYAATGWQEKILDTAKEILSGAVQLQTIRS